MNENLNLVEILKGCPKGTKFYSSIWGTVTFIEIVDNMTYPIRIKSYNKTNGEGLTQSVAKDGKYYCAFDGECTLFPSKDQRDWAKFERFWDKPKVEKFNPEKFKKLEPVVVRSSEYDKWYASFFSFIDKGKYTSCYCLGTYYKYCIPYNKVTDKLIGTTNDCPDYYKWWEE